MKLSNILRYHLLPGRQIIQFSPVRTGSTLVYNILRECLPGKTIDKSHTYSKHYEKLPIIATVRHPMDSVASLLQVAEREATGENFRWAVDMLTREGGADIEKLKNHPKLLLLRYEEFYANYEGMFDALEKFFCIEIPRWQRDSISSRHGLEQARRTASQFSSFSKHDPVTKIHGNHISAFGGRPFYHQEFFNEEQLRRLAPLCADLMKSFGYV